MELPFSSLVFVVLWFSISLCTLLVQSQSQKGANGFSKSLSPPSSQPPPSPSSPPPPRPSPPPPQSPTQPPPLPESPTSPPPEPPNIPLPPESPNTPSPPESPSPPPPDRPANQVSSNNDSKRPPPPPYKRQKPRNGGRGQPPPPHRGHKYNAGKKIGLLFVGTAAILQIGVIGFLVFKRRQLLKVKDRYETCS